MTTLPAAVQRHRHRRGRWVTVYENAWKRASWRNRRIVRVTQETALTAKDWRDTGASLLTKVTYQVWRPLRAKGQGKR